MKSKFIYILLTVFAVTVLNSCHCRRCCSAESDAVRTAALADGEESAFRFIEFAADGAAFDGDRVSSVSALRSESFLLHGFRVPVRKNTTSSRTPELSGGRILCPAVYAAASGSNRGSADGCKDSSRYLISLRKLVI